MSKTAILMMVALLAFSSQTFGDEGFKRLDDGKSFKGWRKAAENDGSWTIEDGAFKAKGNRAHLFYVADEKPFVNFELKVDFVNGNAGMDVLNGMLVRVVAG